jgi:hypothetical protein
MSREASTIQPFSKVVEQWHSYWENYREKHTGMTNAVTMAIGCSSAVPNHKLLGAKQNGPLPSDVGDGLYTAPGCADAKMQDAREHALVKKSSWSAGNMTGVHAEVLIIRAWLTDLNDITETGLTKLSGHSVIVASQPACWCCRALMEHYGIAFYDEQGSKPLTGWRHPLRDNTVPNADLPTSEKETKKWITGG